MFDSTPVLEDLVAGDNHRAIRFLKRIGFTIGKEVIMIAGTSFVPFSRSAPMCDPSVALRIAATAVSYRRRRDSPGIGQAQQSRYQAQIADQNARLANDQAQRFDREHQSGGAAPLSRAGPDKGCAGGGDGRERRRPQFKSAVDIQKDTAMIGAEDIAQIYKGGNERTRGFDINAFNFKSQASANRAQASGALMKGIFDGVSTRWASVAGCA